VLAQRQFGYPAARAPISVVLEPLLVLYEEGSSIEYFQNFEELGIRWSFRGRTLGLGPWIVRNHMKGGWWKEFGWLSCPSSCVFLKYQRKSWSKNKNQKNQKKSSR